MRFTALLHHVTVERLRESFFALERDAAPGVDGETWRAYRGPAPLPLPRRLAWISISSASRWRVPDERYETAVKHSHEVVALGLRFRVLALPALIRAKEATGRPKDLAQLPMLKALKRTARAPAPRPVRRP